MHIHARNMSEHCRKDKEEALAVVTSGPRGGAVGGWNEVNISLLGFIVA